MKNFGRKFLIVLNDKKNSDIYILKCISSQTMRCFTIVLYKLYSDSTHKIPPGFFSGHTHCACVPCQALSRHGLSESFILTIV